ncbi:MAG: hypothetical protein AB8H79_11240 [Myxococcota bacterium]
MNHRPALVAITLVLSALPAIAGPAQRAEKMAAKMAAKHDGSADSKVQLKKGVVLVDGAELCTIKKDDVRRESFYVVGLDGTELLYFRWIFEDDNNYFEVYAASDLTTMLYDQDAFMGHKRWAAEQLYNAGVLTAEGLNEPKLVSFAQKVGKEMTRARAERAAR